jgi:DNA-binding response OmpR family regulator
MRIRILVIEDERSLAAAPWDVVLGPEYEVQIARADHLRLHICHFAPAAVIINSKRRPVSNADLCREVRSCKGSAETPLLLLTRSAEESADSLKAGADDCLAKPISHQELACASATCCDVRGLPILPLSAQQTSCSIWIVCV